MRKAWFTFGCCLLMVCGLCGCTVWSERKPRVWKDITGGESLERVFWQQVKAKNWNELVPHLASNYVLVTPEGTLDRDAAIERWKHLEIEDYSLGDFNIQLSGNAYVVAYTLMLRGSLAGQPLPATPLRAVTVWQQQGREWIAIAHSVATAR